ncbi:MAG TPA: hypothetical protein VLZ84_09930 [Asticcacaulis sp.]|nr:hypothetical protein [Asticcacaulis sp.]
MGKGSLAKKPRGSAKKRATPPTPAEIRARRERQEFIRLSVEAEKKAAMKNPENWGPADDLGFTAEELTVINSRPRQRRAQRIVYDHLAQHSQITPEQHAAGMKAVNIWAMANGLDGVEQKLLDFVDCSRGEASTMTERRIDGQLRWKRMLDDIGSTSGALIMAISDDWICDRCEDWKAIVRRVYVRGVDTNSDREAKVLAAIVMAALDNLRVHFVRMKELYGY